MIRVLIFSKLKESYQLKIIELRNGHNILRKSQNNRAILITQLFLIVGCHHFTSS